MQPYKYKEIVNRTATKNNTSPELVQSVTDFMFKSTKEEMFKFSNLRIHLPYFVTWYYGRDRLKKFTHIIAKIAAGTYKMPYWLEKLKEEGRNKVYDSIEHLLDVYVDFVEEKRTIKAALKKAKQLNQNNG